MKILIADDSDEKVNELRTFFESISKKIEIQVCDSFKDTISLVMDNQFDLVMLDMTMPTKSKGRRGKSYRKRSLAGKDVLSTLNYYGIKNTKFIIFTKFGEFGRMDDVVSMGEIYNQLSKTHSEILLGYITYDNSSDLWKKNLDSMIKKEGFVC